MSTLQLLLVETADIIERNAAALRECHAIDGEWCESEPEVKAAYETEMDNVRRLREAAMIFDPKNWKAVRRRSGTIDEEQSA